MAKHSLAALNDAFRRGQPNIPGRVVMTRGIAALSEEDIQSIVEKVKAFDNFTEDNDPYGEHDFGSFEHNGEKVFFKLDYYDLSMQKGSEDPIDLTQTIRVLTIMKASEY